MDNSYIRPKNRKWLKRLIFLVFFVILAISIIVVGKIVIGGKNSLEKTDFIPIELSGEIIGSHDDTLNSNYENINLTHTTTSDISQDTAKNNIEEKEAVVQIHEQTEDDGKVKSHIPDIVDIDPIEYDYAYNEEVEFKNIATITQDSDSFVPDPDQDFISDKKDDGSSEKDDKSVSVKDDDSSDDSVDNHPEGDEIVENAKDEEKVEQKEAKKDEIESFSHSVEDGDTIESILLTSGLSSDFIDSFSNKFPELKKLNSNQDFLWKIKNDELTMLAFRISLRQEYVYELQANGEFKRNIIKKESIWKKEIIKGNIDNNFSSSISKMGLSPSLATIANEGLQWQLDLRKLLPTDLFYIYINREYIEDKPTGKSQLLAVKIKSRGKDYYAFKAMDGKFYSEKGEQSTVNAQFRRYPLNFQPRISSPFNLRRHHPITHRISPHKGVDFAVKMGTSVIAPADGRVVKTAYQANGAGRYIVIEHSSKYRTVYMHLSRTLVKVGQSVKRGERIALSGNTGRSTGPHLHYEFHINGKPVNPMRVRLPGFSQGLNSKDKKVFLAAIKSIKVKLDSEN